MRIDAVAIVYRLYRHLRVGAVGYYTRFVELLQHGAFEQSDCHHR